MEVEPITLISSLLILLVLGTGIISWIGILANRLPLEIVFPKNIKVSFPIPSFSIALVIAYLGLNSAASIFASEDQLENVSNTSPGPLLFVNAIFSVLLMGLILASMKFHIGNLNQPITFRAYGITIREFFRQFTTAIYGVCLSFPLVMIFMQFATGFRSDDKPANPLLQILGESPSLDVIFLIVFLAVVVAPFLEELMFRVVLQGWLTRKIGAQFSLPCVALLFSIAHGLPDAIGLLPLALILGVMYHRGDRYYAIVMTHALFNSIMLFAAWANANAVKHL